jgi:UDP-N-acetylmuramoyl-tripeptide--D-alanyl-D-alanine ligase
LLQITAVWKFRRCTPFFRNIPLFQRIPATSGRDLYFALKGAHFDGNRFAAEALKSGAALAVVDDASVAADNRYIMVDDTLSTLQQLAVYHRRRLQIPVIGVTGTNGKTTTKELLYAVLSQQYRTLATAGNLNNHLGVPLTVLSITSDTEIAIIEMGANHVGEIALLCHIAQPSHGLSAP